MRRQSGRSRVVGAASEAGRQFLVRLSLCGPLLFSVRVLVVASQLLRETSGTSTARCGIPTARVGC